MKDEVQVFIEDFFEEFLYRIESLTSNQPDKYINKEILRVLIDNLILKYENRISGLNKSLLAKLIPFLSSNGFDYKFEKVINRKLDSLNEAKEVRSSDTQYSAYFKESIPRNWSTRYNQKNDTIHTHNIYKQKNSSPINKNPEIILKSGLQNIPEIALKITPIEGKDQDYVDYFVFEDGSLCLILCDGVSGDGEKSKFIAKNLPRLVFFYLEKYLPEKPTISRWKAVLKDSLQFAISKMKQTEGSTTFIICYIPCDYEIVYTGWLGDGHILHFNHNMTGFAKLLTPHQDKKGILTSAVTSKGILGEISTQIMSTMKGGVIILSSDGYKLTNGRILQHFYQTVLLHDDLNEGLRLWTNAVCENETLHPEQMDDQSIIIMRWKTEEIK